MESRQIGKLIICLLSIYIIYIDELVVILLVFR